jgi:hypothetical protein
VQDRNLSGIEEGFGMTIQDKPSGNPGPALAYVERPEISETYADYLETVVFDGTSIRMEFVVNRFDRPSRQGTPSGRRVTAARLVLPTHGAANLASQLNSLLATLQEQDTVDDLMLIQSHGGLN